VEMLRRWSYTQTI